MPTQKPRITITMSDDQLSQIEEYRYEKRMKNQTQAILSLIEKGIDVLASSDPAIKKAPSLPDEALKVAHDYNDLDTHGKSMTRMVITEEQKRMDEEKKAAELRRREKELVLMDEELGEPVESRVIPLYLTAAAAGYTAPVFGEDFDYIEVGGDVPRHADFAVKIDGDSMEPYIMNGSTVYVNRDPLADGDVGIFCLDGDMLCKQYHKDAHGVVRLLSLNRARADADRVVSDSSTLACFGRVILPHQIKVVI